jgi:NAD(P)-dependent dehydrogenase (short-subunit alcohol dehydrogenase family)
MRRLAPTFEIRRNLEQTIPLRFEAKDELADLALFLCSDAAAAAYNTGAVYVCDGGSSLARSTFSGIETIAASST